MTSPESHLGNSPSRSDPKCFTWNISGYVTPTGENGTLVQNGDGTYTYTEKDGSKENYDIFGRLASVFDPKGNSLKLTYISDYRTPLTGLLLTNLDLNSPRIVSYDYRLHKIEEMDSTGRLTGVSVTFSYDVSTGRLDGLWDNTGRTVTFFHDDIGNLTGVTGPSGNVSYGYYDTNNRHSLTNIDEGQGEYINAYDSRGRVINQIHAGGMIEIEYIVPRKVRITTTVKDAEGNQLNVQVRNVEFSDKGMVVQNTDTFGNVTNYIRDPETSKITREEYWENIVTGGTSTIVLRTANEYFYDSVGNILTKTEAQGASLEKATTYTYHPTFNRVETELVKSVVNAAQNRIVTNYYDPANGNLKTVTEAGFLREGETYSYVTEYDYYPSGQLKSIDGPRTDVSDITTYYYDPVNNFLTSVTQPIIGTTIYANHDALGNPQTVTDPNGNSTTYTYDSAGRATTAKASGDSAATQYFYVAGVCSSCGSGAGANKIDYIILPEGNMIDYSYDVFGNLVKISDSAGNSINYIYDSEGNRLKEDIRDAGDSLQKTLSYQYDAMNRIKKTINPDSTFTEYGYDYRGNKKIAKDPNGNTTTYNYDELNRLHDVIQPDAITTIYGYNTNNNLTSVTDANNNATTYKYDDKGSVYQVISPDTGTTTYSYDAAGNMVSKTDAKEATISYHYDALNRLMTIDFPSDTDINYSYDNCLNGKGRLCAMAYASGTTSYEYSKKGQIAKETKVIDSVNYVTQYSYDMNGNLKTMTYPGGRVITYNYTNDRAITVLNNASNLASNINYKPFAAMSSINYGNGITGSISYDNQYRIIGIQAGAILNLNYNLYDANGNIKSIQNALDTTKNKSFDYDSLGRLGTANGSWGSLGWTYDGVGNRLAENATNYTYAPSTNRLTSANNISFGYDNNGNTTTEGGRQYFYNQNQRLIQVNDGEMTANYTYNGNGQRVKKVVNGTATIFHYNANGHIIAESNTSGTITAEYVYLNGQPLAKIEGANTYYYHNDHLATPQKMTDASGTVVWAADYKPFGEATITVSTITNNLRFTGQSYDSETGLHYNYIRDYNPVIGRYVQADVIGLKGGINLYRYVLDNPIRFIDEFGLSPADVAKLLAEGKNFTDQMTRNGERTDPGIINNLLISCRALGLCKNEYNGCGGQSDALKDHLNDFMKNNQFDDTWTIEKVYNLPVHFNLQTTSSNPNDPVLILDPHANQFGVKK